MPSGNDFDNVNHSIYHGASIQGENRWYGTIQDAIDASDLGDTVSVVSGPFDENLQINKSISLKGVQNNINPINGRSNVETILNGDTASTIRILQNTSDVTINGFIIENSGDYYTDAGIHLSSNNNQINDVILINNKYGIFFDQVGINTIENSIIQKNYYGIRMQFSNNNTVTNNILSEGNYHGIQHFAQGRGSQAMQPGGRPVYCFH